LSMFCLILKIIWSLSTHGRQKRFGQWAELLFNCVSTTVQYWYQWICTRVSFLLT
jgi:hypothetical protein